MASKNVACINDLNFDAEVLQSRQPFVLVFGAPWCGPCRALSPIIERLADERLGEVRVGKVDADESPAMGLAYGIRGLPTVVVFRQGQETARHLGVATSEKIASLLQAAARPAEIERAYRSMPERSAEGGDHQQCQR
jgi:thioredoxin